MKSKSLLSAVLLSWGCVLSSSAVKESTVVAFQSAPYEIGVMEHFADFTELGTIPQDTIKENAQEEADEAVVVPECPPEYPGGMKELLKFLQKNVQYPKQCLKMGIQGKVAVQFVVDTDGSICDIEVVRKVHPLLDEEAVRVIKMMPKWKPGTSNGKNVRVRFTLPVGFNLHK